MRNFKIAISLILVLMLALGSVMLMASCGDEQNPPSSESSNQGSTGNSDTNSSTGSSNPDNENPDNDNPNVVSVKVVDQKGKAISGAKVQICQGELCFSKPIVTGNDGTGSREYTLDGSQLKAKVLSVPGYDDYLSPAELGYIYFQSGSRELTITVRKVTVNVFDQDQKAVEGAEVQLYQGEHAFADEIFTDADGVAYATIAVSGEEISAVVTEVASGSGYKPSKTPTLFGIGAYEGTVTVEKLSQYSVKISTMTGGTIENARVELFDVASDMKQATVNTDASGVARFENIAPGEYYVKVTFDLPIYKIINENVDGKFFFSKNSKIITLEVVELENVTYKVNGTSALAGTTASVYDYNHNYKQEITFDEKGVATFTAPYAEYIVECDGEIDGKYIVPVVFSKNGGIEAEVSIVRTTPGIKANPCYIVSYIYEELEADSTVWFAVPFSANKTLTFYVSASNGFVINWADGSSTPVEEQEYTVDLSGVETTDGLALFSVECEEAFECEITVSAPGSYELPYDLNELVGDDINGKSIKVDLVDGQTVYFTYTPNIDGTLTITLPYTSVIIGVDDVLEIESVTTSDNKTTYVVPLTKDEAVKFYVYAMDLETFEAVDIKDAEISFIYEDTKEDYSVVVYKDLEICPEITVILYKRGADGELVELQRAVSDENGTVKFAGISYSKDYVVDAIVPENYEVMGEDVSFGYLTELSLYLNHEKDGSIDYPYGVDFETGAGTINVAENSVVWLFVKVHESFDGAKNMLAINNALAQFTVYMNDTNGDGKVDQNDTPYATSSVIDGKATYIFAENGKEYMIAISTTDGSAAELEYKYSQLKAVEGETPDNAKEISEPTVAAEDISAGKTVYYRFTGDSCKLIVTLNGEGVSLKQVVFEDNGEYELKDAENNIFIVDNTNGEWIYFAVVAEIDATYEVDVTIE